ncbi:sulfotransferase 1A3-like [Liolophura sinensis]|uniref:sulfotransferase 1A3-like n=1 Tax=Liolophura sinensis TaxID=3198878 RepID=UPI0031583631
MELPPLSADVLAHYRRCIPGLHTVDGIPWHGSMFPQENFVMRNDDVLLSGYPKSGCTHFYFILFYSIPVKFSLPWTTNQTHRKYFVTRFMAKDSMARCRHAGHINLLDLSEYTPSLTHYTYFCVNKSFGLSVQLRRSFFSHLGNHWLGEIIYMILIGGDQEKANQKKIGERIHWLELHPVKPEEDNIQRFADLPSPRVLMTHNPNRLCPQSRDKKFKTVIILRSPKDIAVSFYKFHQMLDFIRYDRPWEDFLSLFMHGEVMYGSWFDVVLDWWKRKDDPSVCFVKYEDLKKDLRSGVETLASFLGVSLTEDQLQSVVNHCTFHNMKANPMSNVKADFMDEQVSPFLRKGIVGDWKNYFTVAQNELFNAYFESRMKNSGISMAFE